MWRVIEGNEKVKLGGCGSKTDLGRIKYLMVLKAAKKKICRRRAYTIEVIFERARYEQVYDK